MPATSRYLLSFVLLAFATAACTDSSEPARLGPPQGTGTLTVDMAGVWEITTVQRLDPDTLTPITVPPRGFTGIGGHRELFPPHVGQQVMIADKLVKHLYGDNLYQPKTSPSPLRYVNQANGQTVLFHITRQHAGTQYTSMDLQFAFGTVSQDQLDGYVLALELMNLGNNVTPGIPEDPNGMFRVVLSRR